MDKKIVISIGFFLAVNLIIVAVLRSVVSDVANLYELISSSNLYFVPDHFFTLYVLTPLIVIAAIVVLVMPGTLLILAHNKNTQPGELLLKGFGASFLLLFFMTTCIKLITGSIVTPDNFIFSLSLITILVFGYFYFKVTKNQSQEWFFFEQGNRRQIYWSFVIIAAITVILLPVLFWQDLNDDGFEALEIGRSLATKYLPAFPYESESMGLGIGMLPMAYPVHWFIMLFGPIEVAARLPMVLYVIVMFAGLIAMIETGSRRKLFFLEEVALVLGLVTYVIATSYNSGYDPYFSDIASPAAFASLTVLLMIGSGYFIWTGQRAWFLLFTLLGFLARPTLLLFVLLMGLGLYLVMKKESKSRLYLISVSIGLWFVLLLGYEHFYLKFMLEGSVGYPTSSILTRFQYIRIDDIQRFVYVAAAGGLIPFLSIFAFKWQDPLSRCIAFVSISYFMIFYFPAFTALHHYVPVMVLPMVVLWRVIINRTDKLWPAGLVGLMACIFIWLSYPKHLEVNRVFRGIGAQIDYQIGDFNGGYNQYRAAIKGSPLLLQLFKNDWDVMDPSREMVGGQQILYYASRQKNPNDKINYLVAESPLNEQSAGLLNIYNDDAGFVYVKSETLWKQARYNPMRTDFRSALYDIPQTSLFPYKGIPAGNYILNLGALPVIWKLFNK